MEQLIKELLERIEKMSLHFFNDNEDENENRMHHRNLFL